MDKDVSLLQYPGGYFVEGYWGDGFFDLAVLAGGAGLAGLEEVVEVRQALDRDVPVSAFLEGGFDDREIRVNGDLKVLFAV